MDVDLGVDVDVDVNVCKYTQSDEVDLEMHDVTGLWYNGQGVGLIIRRPGFNPRLGGSFIPGLRTRLKHCILRCLQSDEVDLEMHDGQDSDTWGWGHGSGRPGTTRHGQARPGEARGGHTRKYPVF